MDQLDHVVERVMALIVTLIGAWVVVYFSLWKSVRSIGKVGESFNQERHKENRKFEIEKIAKLFFKVESFVAMLEK